jgi:iron complex transport system permease protein
MAGMMGGIAFLFVLVVSAAALLLAHTLVGPGLSVYDALTGLVGADRIAAEIVWTIRIPRGLCALLVGAALGLSGAGLQGLLRNPLADAGVLGVSGFASLGAVIAFAFGLAHQSAWSAPAMAIVFALSAAGLVCGFGMRLAGVAPLILVGVGVSSLAGAGVALALNLSPSPLALADLVNWTLGSVANRSMEDIALVGPFLIGGASFLFATGRALGVMSLGDEAAGAMGVNVAAARACVVFGVALLAGAATALAGVIGFVGVAAPHLVRARFDHDPARVLLPSALMGAALVGLADLGVRLAPFDQPLALGVSAALLGAPIFILAAAKLAHEGA